jgi:hypothetical protein
VIFCNFFRIFWTPNGKKRLVATASTRGPIRSRHVDQSDRVTSLSPRQCLASLSPASRPGGRSSADESEAIPPALAGRERHRPAPASRPPLAHARATTASSRLRCRAHCHQPYYYYKACRPDYQGASIRRHAFSFSPLFSFCFSLFFTSLFFLFRRRRSEWKHAAMCAGDHGIYTARCKL